MPQTKDQNEYIVNDAALPNLGLPAGTGDDLIVAKINASLDAPLLVRASFPTANTLLNFEASEVANPDGTGRAAPAIKSSIPIIPVTSIDFQSQVITGGTINIVWPTTVVGQYYRVGFTLVAGNQIQANFSPAAATLSAVADPGTLFISGGTALSWVDLQATSTTGQFKTADSTTNIIENQNSLGIRIHRFGAGTGSGSGDGNGNSHEPADGFQADFWDEFSVAPTNAASQVNPLLTNATYNNGQLLYQISCDKAPTATTTGTAFTLSAAPGFTLKPNDILWSGGAWRVIKTLSSQTAGTLDAAFPTNLAAAACMVSQAVWTTDQVNFGSAAQGDRGRDLFPGVDLSLTHLEYKDSLASGDNEPDLTQPARVVAAASNVGLATDTTTFPLSTDFSPLSVRPTLVATAGIQPSYPDYPLAVGTVGSAQRLFLVFFANPLESSVTSSANLISYDMSAYPDRALQEGGVLWSFQCQADGSGSNGLTIDNTGAVSILTLPAGFNFVPGINSNPLMADGDAEVLLDGKGIPRFFTGVVGAYWKEVTGSTNQLALYANIGSLDMSVKVVRRQGSNDTSDANALAIAAIRDVVVGTVAQVAGGLAQYSSLQAAHDALAAGSKIQMIGQPTDTTLNWSKAAMIVESRGFSVLLNAVVTLLSGADHNVFKYVKFGAAITLNSNGNHLTDCWKPVSAAFADNGTENDYTMSRY